MKGLVDFNLTKMNWGPTVSQILGYGGSFSEGFTVQWGGPLCCISFFLPTTWWRERSAVLGRFLGKISWSGSWCFKGSEVRTARHGVREEICSCSQVGSKVRPPAWKCSAKTLGPNLTMRGAIGKTDKGSSSGKNGDRGGGFGAWGRVPTKATWGRNWPQ